MFQHVGIQRLDRHSNRAESAAGNAFGVDGSCKRSQQDQRGRGRRHQCIAIRNSHECLPNLEFDGAPLKSVVTLPFVPKATSRLPEPLACVVAQLTLTLLTLLVAAVPEPLVTVQVWLAGC